MGVLVMLPMAQTGSCSFPWPCPQAHLQRLERTIVAKKNLAEKEQKNATTSVAAGFVGETQKELSKVVWPSRQQLLSESAAVILMVTLVATVIYLVDQLFAWGADKVF